ncbi:MAG: YbaY family lipoprotein [Acidobacteriota bacterium]
MVALTGTVTYRARVALPPGAVIDVRLLDVSRADVPATTLVRSKIVTRGEQVPVPFTLRYDAATIQARRRYVVQATITIEGRVAWRTIRQHPVLVEGAPEAGPVVVVLDAVR